jgi:hypothetical protein
MQITGMLYGAKLLDHVGFPTTEVLGPGAGEDQIQNLIRRHGQIFVKPQFMDKRVEYNVFHDFYRELVQALFDLGASRYVFCVNVDAVIAALLLALLWKDYKAGALTERDLETAAFNVFLCGRMIGAAAEIDDHLNRGRNMDTRTPASDCAYVL